MAHKLITSVRKADRILTNVNFIRNFNIFAQVQPKRLELRQFLSQLSSHPPKGFDKPFNQNIGNKSGACTAGEIGADRKSSSLSGGVDGGEGADEKSKGGPGSDAQLRDCVINLGIVAPLLLNSIQPDTSITFLRQMTAVIVNLCICIDRPPRHQIVLEVLPALNDIVQHSDPFVLLLAAWALKNLAEGGKDQIQIVIDSGVLPKLVQLLNHGEVKVQEPALRAVDNIVKHGTNDQIQAVLNCDALAHFHNLLNHPKKNICEIALQILSKVAASNFSRVQAVIDAGLVPRIIHHLEKGDFQTQKAAAKALSFMTMKGTTKQVEHLIDCGVIPLFTNFLNCKDSVVRQVAATAIQNILIGADDQMKAVLNCVALSHFHNLLNPKETTCKWALWVLKLVIAKKFATVQVVIDAGLIPLIIHHLENRKFQTQEEAAWALYFMTINGNKEQMAHFIDCGVISPFCNILNSKDSEVVKIVLVGIYNILVELSVNRNCGDKACTLIKECGGWDKIQTLQNHENTEISEIAQDITLKRFFPEDVEE